MKGPIFFRAALALLLALAPAPGWAQTFGNEEITVIVPFSEGGGTDRWARFYAPLLAGHLTGGPEVEVENEPGQGGPLQAANEFAARDHSDGLTLLSVSASLQFPFLLGDMRVKYDYKDWEALLVSPSGGVVYVSPDLKVSDPPGVRRLRGLDMRYIAQSSIGIDIVPLLALEMLDIRPEVEFGADGRGRGFKAFENEEVEIDFQTTPAYLRNVKPLVEEGDAVPLFSLGVLDHAGGLRRDPSFPDIPHFGEVYRLAHGREPSGEKWEIWKTLLAAGFSAQKMLLVQKTATTGTVRAYEEGFKAIMSSPEFENYWRGTLGVYPQHTGAAARRMKDMAIAVDPATRKRIGLWLVNDALPRWTGGAE